jgi:hypothetical protein
MKTKKKKTIKTPTDGNSQNPVTGVMNESYDNLKPAPMTGGTGAGESRGGGAALRGTKFIGVR